MQTHVYDNGFRLIYEPSPLKSQLTSIKVYCDIGSIHEPDGFRGSAHFIEHMCFKGTHKLKNTRIISNIFDKTGAYLNAYTDRRHTCYYTNGIANQTGIFIETLADMLCNSVFDPVEYAKEHDVVREEMTKDEDDATTKVFENADKHIYAGSPYEHPVDHISYHRGKHSLALDTVFAFYKQYYVPSRFILSICSQLSFATIKAYVDKCDFTKHCTNSLSSPLTLMLTPQNTMQIHIERKSNILPTYICIGWRTCPITHRDKYPIKILKNALSGPLNSRLFTLLREENGLTYSSSAESFYAEHMGDFKISAECDSSKVFRNKSSRGLGVFPLIIQLVHDLVQNGITQTEMQAVKTYMLGKMTLNAEDCETIAAKNAKHLLYNLPYVAYKDRYKTFIEPIKLKDVNACIKKYLRPENMTISIVSNNAEALRKTNYEKIVAKYLQ